MPKPELTDSDKISIAALASGLLKPGEQNPINIEATLKLAEQAFRSFIAKR